MCLFPAISCAFIIKGLCISNQGFHPSCFSIQPVFRQKFLHFRVLLTDESIKISRVKSNFGKKLLRYCITGSITQIYSSRVSFFSWIVGFLEIHNALRSSIDIFASGMRIIVSNLLRMGKP